MDIHCTTYLTDLHRLGLFSVVLISLGALGVFLCRVFPWDLVHLVVLFFPSYHLIWEGPADQCVQVHREDLVGLKVLQEKKKRN